MKASNETAQKFQAKVADEILPSIRKHGVYLTAEAAEKILFNPDFIINLAQQVKTAQAERDAALAQVAELKPKADYCEKVLTSEETFPVTVIAKEYGMSAQTFNALLVRLKIQYPIQKTFALFQSYAGKGYTKMITTILRGGLTSTQMQWTQRGREFLYFKLKQFGTLPTAEQESAMATLF